MKFTSKLVKKAWELFKIKSNGKSLKEAKAFLSDAYKQAIKYFQGLKKGVITFWKLETGEICKREVISLSDANYQNKTDKKSNPNMFYFWDVNKGSIIGINNYQIL